MQEMNRRDFVGGAAAAGIGFWVAGGAEAKDSRSPNEKVNVAIIGAGGQGGGNLNNIHHTGIANIVALCDVDEERAKDAFKNNAYAKAEKFKDFRIMLEKRKDIDAVVVSTPDHTHAVATIMAMKMGKHVYCEKPLTHTPHEARVVRQVAKEMKVVTQMGNHGSASSGLRQAVEMLHAGVIGAIKEIHVWTNRPIWPQGIDRPTQHMEPPKTLAWDLWLGPAPERAYNKAYLPFNWRGWWDYGTGALGDMACHTANMAWRGAQLTAPTAVECLDVIGLNPDSGPTLSTICYEYPKRGDLPETKLFWYEGFRGKKGGNKEQASGRGSNDPSMPFPGKNLPPRELTKGLSLSDSGSLLVGEKGILFSPNDYGEKFTLLPKDKFEHYQAPNPSIPRSPGHHKEWLLGIKGGPTPFSNFEIAGPFTEAMLLGNVALRLGKGRRIEWDAEAGRVTNTSDADHYVDVPYRQGWTLG